jgi:pentatricopeptide repeat protein
MIRQMRQGAARRAATAAFRATRSPTRQLFLAFQDRQPTCVLTKTTSIVRHAQAPVGMAINKHHALLTPTTRVFSTITAVVEDETVENVLLKRIHEKDLQGALICLQEFVQQEEIDDNQHEKQLLPVSVTLAFLQQCVDSMQQSYYDPMQQIQVAQISMQVLTLENLLRKQNRLTGQPKQRHFEVILQAFARLRIQKDKTTGKVLLDPGREAQLILEQALQTFQETQHTNDRVHWKHYHLVLETYRRNNQPGKAERLLLKMGKDKPLYYLDPHLMAYRIVIEAYLQKVKSNATPMDKPNHKDKFHGVPIENILAADALLRYLVHEWELGQNKHIQPELSLFNLVMNAWSESKDPNATKHVESLYSLMIQSMVFPNQYTYSQRINAHANRGDAEGAEEAFLEIYQMSQQADANDLNRTSNPSNSYPPVDIACLNAVLKAWERSNDPQRLEKMSDIIQETRSRFQKGSDKLQPNTGSYITLLSAYAKRGRVSQAAQLVKEMVNDASSGNTTVVMDDVPFNLWLKAVQIAQTVKGGDQADFILDEMKRCKVHPTQYSFATAIACWKKSVEISRKKTDYFQMARGQVRVKELEQFYAQEGGSLWNDTTDINDPSNTHPKDIASLNAVLSAWEQSNDPHRLAKMSDIIKETRSRFQMGLENLQLDTRSYKTLLSVYAKNGLSFKAEHLIQEMLSDARSGNTTLVIDDVPFNLWLKAVQIAQTVKGGDQADIILNEMMRCKVQPTQYTYATAIACWKVTIAISRKMENNQVAQGKERIKELERLLEQVGGRVEKKGGD